MFEFENNYSLDTGNLFEIFSASGVHLQKDVTLSFSFVDPQGVPVDSDIDLRENPLIKEIEYDILDTNGNVLYENYFVGLNRTLTIKELDNISLFGEYKKDFGVRAIISNYLNENKFISEYYVYGNVPEIYSIQVYDKYGNKNYYKYNFWNFNLQSGNLNNFYISRYDSGNIEIDWGDNTENSVIFLTGSTGHSYFENTGIYYDQLELNIDLLNDVKYIIYDYVDIYGRQSISGDLSINDQSFLYRKTLTNIDNQFLIELDNNFLEYDKDYNFIIVPYSKLGSGNSFYIGPHAITKSEATLNSETVETGAVTTSEINLANGDINVNFKLITGLINNNYHIIDIIDKNEQYRTIKYTTQIIENNNLLSSSDLKITISDTGSNSMPDLNEYLTSSNSNINYSLDSSESFFYLMASGVNYPATYKLYKTLM